MTLSIDARQNVTWALLTFVFISCGWLPASRADQDSEKRRIKKRYEVVSFGQRQSFVATLGRTAEGALEWYGFDLDDKSVYEKRYEALKLHWDDVRKKFRENNVDTKTEPIYIGYIDWVHKEFGVVVDHYIQFYVAARKRKKSNEAYDVNLQAQAGEHGGTGQRWMLIPTSDDNVFLIKNLRLWRDWKADKPPARDMVLDYVSDGGFDVNLQPQSGDDGASGQRWIIVPTDQDGVVLIKNFRTHRDWRRDQSPSKDMVLDYTRSGSHFDVNLQPQVGEHGGSGQRWRLISTGEDKVFVIVNNRLWKDWKKEDAPSKSMVLDYTE